MADAGHSDFIITVPHFSRNTRYAYQLDNCSTIKAVVLRLRLNTFERSVNFLGKIGQCIGAH